VVGGAPALLSRHRAALAGLAALAAALGVYYGVSESLWNASLWWDVAFLAIVVIPLVFAVVWLGLPLLGSHWLFPAAGVAVAVAIGATAADLGAFANFAKLVAATLVAFAVLEFLDDLPLVVLIALIVPFIDAWSVWRGPTHVIVEHRKHLFATFAFAFPVPGEPSSAELGLPDLLFFAMFLAACAHFRLRTGWTWLAMTASFGVTMAFAAGFDVGGLPALPGLSIAFLGVNADLLWRRVGVPRPNLKPK
jgi:hypothetical protein